MAEFQEVMRQITRYCKAHEGCASCKLSKITDDNCPSDLFADDNGAKIENEVMAWAEEHPEPVYPTWWEWLVDKEVVDVALTPDCFGGIITEIKPSGKMHEHIPADIAEKLGIEPKEG